MRVRKMNTFEKNIMHVGEMASGAKLTVPVYTYKNRDLNFDLVDKENKKPAVYIQANMHGAEVQGNAVIFQLLELLKSCVISADITLVPYANPVACNHKNGEYTLGRFDPITGENWNRMYHFDESIIEPFAKKHLQSSPDEIAHQFQSLMLDAIDKKLKHNIYGITTGQRIAYQLQQLAHQADIVLDLHTGPISSKHLYCPEYAVKSASYFDIPHTILIPNSFDGAMDEATFCPWWSLQKAFTTLGREFIMGEGAFAKESFTVELGSQEQIDLDVAHQDALGILSYLQYKGVVKPGTSSETALSLSEESSNTKPELREAFTPKKMTRYACYLKNYKALYSPMGGMVDYLADFGVPLAKGKPLVRILRMDNYGDGNPLHYVKLEADVLPILHFASASVNQGTELYKVFTDFFEI
jgi:hypothetical protein